MTPVLVWPGGRAGAPGRKRRRPCGWIGWAQAGPEPRWGHSRPRPGGSPQTQGPGRRSFPGRSRRTLSAWFKPGPGATGGRRWCGFRQPGRMQYTDPAVNTHRSWTWRHNGQTTGSPDRSPGLGRSATSWNIPRRRAQRRIEPRRQSPGVAPLTAHTLIISGNQHGGSRLSRSAFPVMSWPAVGWFAGGAGAIMPRGWCLGSGRARLPLDRAVPKGLTL